MAHAHVRSEAAWKWLRIADLHGGRRRSRVRGRSRRPGGTKRCRFRV